jgi:hypothetical protein
MKEFYEKACLVQPGGVNIIASIKREAANITHICPTIFVKDDTYTFAGESILDQARKEKDDGPKQKQMIQEGVELLLEQPEEIDLTPNSQIIKFLRETHNFMTIVDICLRKAEVLKRSFSLDQQLDSITIQDKIVECYNVIIHIFSALTQDIRDETTKNKEERSQEYKDKLFNEFYQHFKKKELQGSLQ